MAGIPFMFDMPVVYHTLPLPVKKKWVEFTKNMESG
jgi:hypothetical protein